MLEREFMGGMSETFAWVVRVAWAVKILVWVKKYGTSRNFGVVETCHFMNIYYDSVKYYLRF